jgi:hypothetical protein
MLDHPEKTARLLAELKAAVPFKVAPQLVAHLRAEHVVAAESAAWYDRFP